MTETSGLNWIIDYYKAREEQRSIAREASRILREAHEEKRLLLEFAKAVLPNSMVHYGIGPTAVKAALDMAEDMLAEYKKRTEGKIP